MEAVLMPVLLGALVGTLTGLLPGLHVNTLAAVSLGLAPANHSTALFLVAVGIVHTFVGILPATYLGAPAEDSALTVLPAHQMLLQGRGPEAVRVSALASLAAITVVPLVVLPYKWLLLEPGRALAWLEHATAWILSAVLLFLVATEARRGLSRAGWAIVTMGASGSLGWVALPLAPQGFLPGHGSPLLPLLSGLFGAAGLVVALAQAPAIPVQQRPRRVSLPLASLRRGVLAAGWTAVLPGLTGAVATAIAQPTSRSPRLTIATLSVVNTAHAALALPVLWLIGRPRTGLAQAVDRLMAPQSWLAGAPPTDLLHVCAVMVGAGALGYVATRLLDVPFAAAVVRLPARVVSVMGLVVLLGLTALLTGWQGLGILVAATATGLVPLAAGVRRVHLVAALLVPILIRHWGGV